MNPVDLFNQVKELIANKDFEGAKQSEGVNGLLDKVKGLF